MLTSGLERRLRSVCSSRIHCNKEDINIGINESLFDSFLLRLVVFLSGHAHLTDFNIATIIKDGERATALAGTKPYMGNSELSL